MGKYEKYYSEHGLIKMIERCHEKIREKEEEYKGVSEGRLYNPLCADGWKVEIEKEIRYLSQ